MSQATPEQLEAAIRELLAARSADATICPSEAARQVGGDDWRDLMQPARDVVARLADAGEVEATQGGEVVDVRTARGPIRVRTARAAR
ncbi:S-adenosylmethionine tRNA ribosyltransferase [Janibacter melonis]|uniref:S-adenosylmethionine tRNA ribosyltransferase n=1 Tax=Janibacter melonis TaxID=262209 RepID=A0A176QGK7_9MICO|nr:DUF3253 domain-containing protein [Janibacter melonis]OAB88811.1 S-adenosylmethionine tRNA ribosyltransferase [Janibacter melonis]